MQFVTIKDEKGFTGLEAAIVLIAFLVLAAVFSYVMLGEGFFTVQKNQVAVHSGLQQASSGLMLSGDVLVSGGIDKSGKNVVENIIFYLTNAAGGTSIDLNKTMITYTDINDSKEFPYNPTNGAWTYTPIIKNSSAFNLLEAGDTYKVILNLKGNNYEASASDIITSQPGVGEEIKIEVIPPEGAVLSFNRKMPHKISPDTYYPLY